MSVCEPVSTGFVPGILVGEIRGNNRTAGSGRQIDNAIGLLYHQAYRLVSQFPFISFCLGGRVEHTPTPPPRWDLSWGPPSQARSLCIFNTPSAQARSSWLEGVGVPRVRVSIEVGDECRGAPTLKRGPSSLSPATPKGPQEG